jgi:regulatory protein
MNVETKAEPLIEQHKKETQKAIASGCRMLAIREHSTKQLEEKLAKKGFSEEGVAEAIDYLNSENWLSESRFCNSFIRSRYEKGQGLLRIVAELKQQNISMPVITAELAELELQWQECCERVLWKKLRNATFEPQLFSEIYRGAREESATTSISFKEKVKLENFLRYRGFSSEEISYSMKKITALNVRSSKE